MTLKLVPVRLKARRPDGTPAARARATVYLVDANGRRAASTFDPGNGDVVPSVLVFDADDSGDLLMGLWPNQRGTVPTLYRVVVTVGDVELSNYTISVADTDPAVEVPIASLVSATSWPGLTPDQQAVQDAQASMLLSLQYKNAADQDRQATAADRLQVAADRQAVDAAKLGADSASSTAVAQASLAQGYAASAASVAQQDLSGSVAVALYRSPNAIVATCFVDTSRDSVPVWPMRTDHLSYATETLNGKWLRQQASEAAARAVNGATTGDYFQLTTDGKFYRLNAGAGVTETFRGNSARPPRFALAVAESSRVVIFELTTPGWPMWMVITATTNTTALGAFGVATITSLAYREGWFVVGTSTGGCVFDLAKDLMTPMRATAGRFAGSRRIVDRNNQTAALASGLAGADYIAIAGTATALDITTMPEAPPDPTTGLQLPTIAVATTAGLSIVKHDGSVVTNAAAGSFANGGVVITPYAVLAFPAGTSALYALKPSSLGAGYAMTSIPSNAAPGFSSAFNWTGVVAAGRAMFGRRSSGGTARFELLRMNENSIGASLLARITDTHSTGWMQGGTIRCLLADTAVGPLADQSAVADRTFRAKNSTVFGSALTRTLVGAVSMVSGWNATNYVQETLASTDLDPGAGGFTLSFWGVIPTGVAAAGWAVERSGTSGAYYRAGHDATGKIVAEVLDSTGTLRTVTTATGYNTGLPIKVRVQLDSTGALTIKVNGEQAAQATGAPLASLSNAIALLTTGIDRSLTAPWAGSLAMVKVGLTIPTDDASRWMYSQERVMFQTGAVVTLPDAGGIVEISYDSTQDVWLVASSANESRFAGLARVGTSASAGGNISKVAGAQGCKAVARTTINPGVDLTEPAKNLREELLRRAEEAARLARLTRRVDFDAVAGQTKFSAPAGWELQGLTLEGVEKREGASKAWTRSFDGFVESANLGVAPGAGAWLQAEIRRMQ